MKFSNDRSLKEILQELIQTYKLEGKLNEVKAVHSWENVVGEMIANHTKDLYIRSGKLFVKIDSPALKNELTYSSSVIIEKINTEAGCTVIKEIIFL